MDPTQRNCISIVAENPFSELSNSTACGNSDKNSLELKNVSGKENNAPPLQPAQLLNIINTSSIKSETSNVDDDCTMYKFNETLQLNCPILSEVKQPCQKVEEFVRGVSHDITSLSTTDKFNDDISLMALTELKSSEEITVKPMSKIRVRQDLLADKAVSTYLNHTIAFYEDFDYDKEKNELISLGLLTNFECSEVSSDEMARQNEVANSLPIMEPIFKQNEYPADAGVYRQPKKHIPFENRFTRMNRHRYKHTYFDSDGNEIQSNPQEKHE